MVADFGIADHLRCFHSAVKTGGKGEGCRHQPAKRRQVSRHILRQIAGIRARVGCQLFLIQKLDIVQCLLCGIAVYPVGLPLQSGQVIQLWRFLCFFLPFCRLHRSAFPHAQLPQLLCIRPARKPSAGYTEGAAVQIYGIEFFFLKSGNCLFPVCKERQCRRHDAPHVQGFSLIQRCKQARCVDSNQPVRFGAAQGSIIKGIIRFTGSKVFKPLPYGRILH